MTNGMTPEPPTIFTKLARRLKTLSSKQRFAVFLTLLAPVSWFAKLPYGSFLLILSILLLVKARLGVLLFLIATVSVYLTSIEFYRSLGATKYDQLNCAVANWQDIDECKTRGETFYLEAVDEAGRLHKFYYIDRGFEYPDIGILFAADYQAEVEGQVMPDGSIQVLAIESKAADLRPIFDEQVRELVSARLWVNTDSENVSFPATFKEPVRIRVEVGDDALRLFSTSLMFCLVIFFSAGYILARHDSILVYSASVAAPTGIYVSSFYACVAIASYATTNYEMLGKGLLIGSVFLGVGAISSTKTNKLSNDRHSHVNPLGYVLLALLPVFGIATLEDPLLDFWIWGPHFYLQMFGPIFQSVFNNYVIVILFVIGLVSAVYGKQFSTRKKLDFLVAASTALVTVSIVLWFLNMSAITDDYIEIFPVLKIAAIGLACSSLLFIVVVLSADKPVPKLPLRRRVLLLLEVFTFYLFFAYAPASVSQLGQQFEQEIGREEERAGLEERLKAIEELLQIESLDSDYVDK